MLYVQKTEKLHFGYIFFKKQNPEVVPRGCFYTIGLF